MVFFLHMIFPKKTFFPVGGMEKSRSSDRGKRAKVGYLPFRLQIPIFA